MGIFDLFRKKKGGPADSATDATAPAPPLPARDQAPVTARPNAGPAAFTPTSPGSPAVGVEWFKPSDAPAGLTALITEHATRAAKRGLTAHVYFSALWAPPCTALRESLDDPRMRRAFARAYIIELDDTSRGSSGLGTEIGRYFGVVQHTVGMPTYPSFYELDERGELTGRTINGSAWGADTIENMAPPLERYFDGAPR